ncbi:PLAT domain-containing protein 1, partial [Quillaja saponaria]
IKTYHIFVSHTRPEKKMAPKAGALFLFSLFLFVSIATIARSEDDCVFTIYVRTGSIFKGGTDSIISLKLYDDDGEYILIRDIEAWAGIMDPGHNYFERGNLDIFSGRVPCLNGPVCAINVTSDGSGSHHGWYVNYVEVTSTGAHINCAQQLFTIEQWLALDTSPYELYAVKNYCSYSLDQARLKRGDRVGSDPKPTLASATSAS